jgi:hypothetical protein
MILSPSPKQQFFGNNGRPLDGGLLFTYVAGTNTKIATYQNEGGTPNTNPIVLDFRGEANIWLDSSLTYKFILAPKTDTDPPTHPIWSVDDISVGLTIAELTQQFLGAILWPRTQAEIDASVTPTNYVYLPGDPMRYGATRNGVTDDTAAILKAVSVLTDESTAWWTPGRYRFESTQPDPKTGTGASVGSLINAKTNVQIFGYGVTLVVTNANNAILGMFCLYDCTSCGVHGFRQEGSYDGTNWTNSVVGIVGNSVDCSAQDITIDGGYAAVFVSNRQLTYNGVAADEPDRTYVTAWGQNCRRIVSYIGVGSSHRFNIGGQQLARAIFCNGGKDIVGTVSIGPQTTYAHVADLLLFTGENSSVIDGVDITITAHHEASVLAFQVGDSTACTIRNFKIRGIANAGGGVGIVYMKVLGNTGTLIENIDLSGLEVQSQNPVGVLIQPNLACTIRNITLPATILNTGPERAVYVDNTQGATIDGIFFPSGRWRLNDGTNAQCALEIANGTVSNIVLGDLVVDYSGLAGAAIRITSGSYVAMGRVRCLNSKQVFLRGSANIVPASAFDHLGHGFMFKGTLTNGMDLSGLSAAYIDGGSTTITQMINMIPGQIITLYFNGGTQQFTDGANMILNGGTNFTATSDDVLVLMCVDPPAGGPLSTSTMAEVSRSVN